MANATCRWQQATVQPQVAKEVVSAGSHAEEETRAEGAVATKNNL